jgi:hypothetical protein
MHEHFFFLSFLKRKTKKKTKWKTDRGHSRHKLTYTPASTTSADGDMMMATLTIYTSWHAYVHKYASRLMCSPGQKMKKEIQRHACNVPDDRDFYGTSSSKQ